MPPKVQQSNAKHYKSDAITEIREYEGFAHLLPAQKGWEEIADSVLQSGGRARRRPAVGSGDGAARMLRSGRKAVIPPPLGRGYDRPA